MTGFEVFVARVMDACYKGVYWYRVGTDRVRYRWYRIRTRKMR